MKKILFILMLFPLALSAQRDTTQAKPGGTIMLGMRTTTSLFSEAGHPGLGIGGQFRVRFTDRLNSDWFADYITSDIGGLGKRTDYHIGWSVLFYPIDPEGTRYEGRGTFARPVHGPKRFVPYVLAGHCFDYTQVQNNDPAFPKMEERWSSAIQTGLGTHWNITKSFDLSLTSQYMMHLGGDVHTEIIDAPDGNQVLLITKHDHLSLEGHLLVTLSLNVRVADLWSK